VFCKEFALHTTPNFLEGPIRQMKTMPDLASKQAIYQRAKASGMYDSALKMYKLSESLEPMAQECGRTKAFTPGWYVRKYVRIDGNIYIESRTYI
jgi:hypothetical protein